MASAIDIVLHASAAVTADGSGAQVDIAAYRGAAKLVLEVSAISGTLPLLTVFVQTSPSGTTWTDVGSFATVNGTSVQELAFSDLRRYVRARWVVAGTLPSFTFALSGEAHLVLAQMRDVNAVSLPAGALVNVAADLKACSLIDATDLIVGYLERGSAWPKTTWGGDLRRACSIIAAYDLMVGRGFDPDRYDENFRKRYEDIIKWLEKIAEGTINPTDPGGGTDPGTGTSSHGTPRISSLVGRGW